MSEYEPYLSETDITGIVNTLALEIDNYCFAEDVNNLMVISILNGSLFFTSDLLKQMNTDVELQTIRIKSYVNNTNKEGEFVCVGLEDVDVSGRTVLIIDDVYDTGQTMDWLRTQLNKLGAKKVLSCALIDKLPGHPEKESKLDFVGHTMTEKKFLVGYGMDDNGHYRSMKDIVVII